MVFELLSFCDLSVCAGIHLFSLMGEDLPCKVKKRIDFYSFNSYLNALYARNIFLF